MIPTVFRTLARTAAPVLVIATATFAVEPDAALPTYVKVEGVSGNLNSVGSDTLNNVMTAWAEGFSEIYPNVNIQIEGKGSTTAPPALIEGTSQLGPMSRQMKKEELDAFEKRYGYKPTELKVAIDALAIFVHKDNPATGMTMKEVDGIFSSTFKAGGKDVTKWGDLALTGGWETKAISIYGRNSASGTYGFFKETALKKGDYKNNVKEQPGSSGVVQGVATDANAIGYSGMGYITSGVKALPLGESKDKLIQPSYENCLNGSYPLARYLYVYINKTPNKPMDTLTLEFVKYLLSKEGQAVVVKDGYYPLPAAVEAETIKSLTK